MDPFYERLPRAEPDGLPAPDVGEWSLQKYTRLWNYLGIFTTGMKNAHRERVYVDLFAGAGKNIIRGSNEWVLGSPLLALAVKDPFTRCIFCEADAGKAEALRVRAAATGLSNWEVLNVDANHEASRLAPLIPDRDARTFCFVDPYNIAFDLNAFARLARARRMDVLILLAVQMDARRNLAVYRQSENAKLDLLFGGPEWRDGWARAEKQGIPFARWFVSAFTDKMVGLGYQQPNDADVQTVRLKEASNQGLYHLSFYSRHPLGYRFWRQAVQYASAQIGFDL